MIRDFWVKNYLSIRDKQEISFLTKGPARISHRDY